MVVEAEFSNLKSLLCAEAALRILLPGEILIQPGQIPGNIYWLEDGKLQLKDLKTQKTNLLKPPALLGLNEFILVKNHSEMVEVLETSYIFHVSSEVFSSIFESNIQLRETLLQLFCKSLSKKETIFE